MMEIIIKQIVGEGQKVNGLEWKYWESKKFSLRAI